MTQNLWHTLRYWDKEKKHLHVRDLSQNLKVYLNLKGSQDHSLVVIISLNQKAS